MPMNKSCVFLKGREKKEDKWISQKSKCLGQELEIATHDAELKTR